jgi:hypothetical protein
MLMMDRREGLTLVETLLQNFSQNVLCKEKLTTQIQTQLSINIKKYCVLCALFMRLFHAHTRHGSLVETHNRFRNAVASDLDTHRFSPFVGFSFSSLGHIGMFHVKVLLEDGKLANIPPNAVIQSRTKSAATTSEPTTAKATSTTISTTTSAITTTTSAITASAARRAAV